MSITMATSAPRTQYLAQAARLYGLGRRLFELLGTCPAAVRAAYRARPGAHRYVCVALRPQPPLRLRGRV